MLVVNANIFHTTFLPSHQRSFENLALFSRTNLTNSDKIKKARILDSLQNSLHGGYILICFSVNAKFLLIVIEQHRFWAFENEVLSRHLDPQKEVTSKEDNCTTRSFVICNVHKVALR